VEEDWGRKRVEGICSQTINYFIYSDVIVSNEKKNSVRKEYIPSSINKEYCTYYEIFKTPNQAR
jgi:hypothetical protein